MDILRAENIVKRYRNHTALSGVNIAVPEGSIFGLLGPNGAGKTSLIRIINQITGPDEGTVYFRDEKLSPHHLSNIGYLPEERGLYKKMKVGEQSLYLARLNSLAVVPVQPGVAALMLGRSHLCEDLSLQGFARAHALSDA
ncbi:MAG TPA: hypothetical protein DCD96_00825, partial [Flavobacteriales bacterium]|nr:hypothetical protein [Flavobacteriales bacterium]